MVGTRVVPIVLKDPPLARISSRPHPPTFTLTDEPLEAEHWLRILEQKFLLLNVADEHKVCFAT